ncbi:hypothetical protein BC835DRAFT_1378339 [Cytidiella melzeri]|nr:hypothetical protein BC835DRAFT_1378339 [Cytidiella melzeri]
MPPGSRAQRAEAKYNVVLDFPNYGLHAAAAAGNLGLVKYALDHGQPVNSALDGLLPLHAACHGGSDLVVRLLIEHGADVNAPRLPRRYATEKSRAATPPLSIPGPAGFTPLHFASSNGHSVVVMTLLLHGASPDRPDKHRTTPEMEARQNGHTDCADVLRKWCHNKDRDLREREAAGTYPPEDSFSREDKSHPYCGSLDCRECATRKRIRMKRSIDNAFHMLRHSPSQTSTTFASPQSSAGIQNTTSLTAEVKPLGEYTFFPTNTLAADDLPPRRPSLPHVLEVPRASTSSHRSRRPSNMSTSSSRPRSAGTDAEPNQRVKSKISLLSIFKKANEVPVAAESSSTSALNMTPLSSHSSDMLAPTTHHRLLSQGAKTDLPVHLAEVRHAASRESLYDRGRNLTAPNDTSGKLSPPVRPGILRAHGRSTSSSQTSQADSTRSVPTAQSSVRALRFDAAPSPHASLPRRTDSFKHGVSHESRSPSRHVQGRGSKSPSRSPSPGSGSFGLRLVSEPEVVAAAGTPSVVLDSGHGIEENHEEEDEDEYGHPVEPQVGIRDLEARLSGLDVAELHRNRRTSIQSTVSEVDSQDTLTTHVFQCPFSINRPPPEDADPQLLGRTSTDSQSRMRGNSMSSMITDSSAGPPSSFVPTPSIQESTLPGPIFFAPSSSVPNDPSPFEGADDRKDQEIVVVQPRSGLPGGKQQRPKTPGDIDIRSISTHAQAEALVALAQRRILDSYQSGSGGDLDEQEIKTLGLSVSEGHTPLSARLAAYGESLAIERRFKQQVEEEETKKRSGRRSSALVNSVSASTLVADPGRVNGSGEEEGEGGVRAVGLGRQMSLQERSSSREEGESWKQNGSLTSLPKPSRALLITPPRMDATSVSNPERTCRLHRAFGSSSNLNILPTAPYSQFRSDSLPVERYASPRSRTPDPPIYDPPTLGAPLTRYQTCPTEDSYGYDSSARTPKERQTARAQKLAKMGFSGSGGGDHFRETSAAAAYVRPQRQRFGGIKTLVQSLTGKA